MTFKVVKNGLSGSCSDPPRWVWLNDSDARGDYYDPAPSEAPLVAFASRHGSANLESNAGMHRKTADRPIAVMSF
jgi:hypothetical protein